MGAFSGIPFTCECGACVVGGVRGDGLGCLVGGVWKEVRGCLTGGGVGDAVSCCFFGGGDAVSCCFFGGGGMSLLSSSFMRIHLCSTLS